MRSLAKHIPAVFAAGLLAGCGGSSLAPTAISHGQRSLLPGVSPAAAYTMLARQVKACWFNPADPVLPEHIFRAEAPASGAQDASTRIVVYTKAPDGRLGLKAYSVLLEPQGRGTAVITENHKLDYPLAQKLTADVGYWIQGSSSCDSPDAAGALAPRGAVAVER